MQKSGCLGSAIAFIICAALILSCVACGGGKVTYKTYENFPSVPDFGDVTGLELLSQQNGKYVYELPAAKKQHLYIQDYEDALILANFEDIDSTFADADDIEGVSLYDNDYIIYARKSVYVFVYAPSDEHAEEIEYPQIFILISTSKFSANTVTPTPEPTPTSVPALTTEQLAEKCSPAVFKIETFDRNGYAIGTGSGSFISPDGVAVTNVHVMDGAFSAVAVLTSGERVDIEGWYDYDDVNDIVLIKVEGRGYQYPYLQIGDDSLLKQGERVYAIGSPLGLDNTFTEGLISNISRTEERDYDIQFTAPISNGNSGGALINASGELIGVPTWGVTTSAAAVVQNLNFATPISYINGLELIDVHALPLGSTGTFTQAAMYSDFPTVPDFGSVSGLFGYGFYEDVIDGYTYYYIYYETTSDAVAQNYIDVLTVYYGFSEIVLAPIFSAYDGDIGYTDYTTLVDIEITDDGYTVIFIFPDYFEAAYNPGTTPNPTEISHYSVFPGVPDFGAYFGVASDFTYEDEDGLYGYYWYNIYGPEYVTTYENLLLSLGFTKHIDFEGDTYYESASGYWVYIEGDPDLRCITVFII